MANGQAEVALLERDWNRIEAELDTVRPGTAEMSRPMAAHQVPEVSSQLNEEQLLKHIACALRLDTVQ